MNHMDETNRFMKFKELVEPRLCSTGCHLWLVDHGIGVVEEPAEIAPVEVFFIGLRSGEVELDSLPPNVLKFVEMVGDRVPVSNNEDFAYLFPRDLYDKILLFGMLPR